MRVYCADERIRKARTASLHMANWVPLSSCSIVECCVFPVLMHVATARSIVMDAEYYSPVNWKRIPIKFTSNNIVLNWHAHACQNFVLFPYRVCIESYTESREVCNYNKSTKVPNAWHRVLHNRAYLVRGMHIYKSMH